MEALLDVSSNMLSEVARPEPCDCLTNPLGRPTMPVVIVAEAVGVEAKNLGLVMGCDELAKPVLAFEDGVPGVGRGLFLCSEGGEMVRQ